jgi:hypothetical protein
MAGAVEDGAEEALEVEMVGAGQGRPVARRGDDRRGALMRRGGGSVARCGGGQREEEGADSGCRVAP